MYIEIEYSDAALFGDGDGEGYDIAASIDKFDEMLLARLEQEYPGAEMEIERGINDRHRVNGLEDHEEAVWVGEIISQVWAGFHWLVELGGE